MIEEGLSASEIKLKLEQAKQKMAIFIAVDDLKYLRRGGRISSGAAVAGQILNIKPILSLDIGILELYKKCRGLQKAKKTMIEDCLLYTSIKCLRKEMNLWDYMQ